MKNSILITSLLLILAFSLSAQKKTKIDLLHTDRMNVDKKLGKGIKRLQGNVKFKHGNTYMYCDSAYHDSNNNKFTAFSNVHINDNDSVQIYGDILEYEGNNKSADLNNNVRLEDGKMTLTTNHLTYDLEQKVGNYYGGGTIVDESNTLTSYLGTYYSESKVFYFKQNVILINPEYHMKADTLKYNTLTEVSYFLGPTTIHGEENLIYCENGWYNSVTNISQYNENAYLENNEQKLQGDSLYYNRNLSLGKAFENVTLTDTVQDVIIYGHYAEYFESGGKSFMTDSALAVFIDEKDSLFLHSDTLLLLFDSLQEAEFVIGFHHTRFYRNDFQGKCDSIVYNFKDSIVEMYHEPVIWSENSQLSGAYIKLIMEDKEVRRAIIEKNGFAISNDTLENFNQVKGRLMTGHFSQNKLRKVDVKGNAETLYFARDEDEILIGINISTSSSLRAIIKGQGIETIHYYSQPEATMHPEEKLSSQEKRLKDFNWLESIRPTSRHDVFRTED